MTILLSIIYLAFISLGLPDSLLGSAWPVMHVELGVATSYAGIITMIISFGTIDSVQRLFDSCSTVRVLVFQLDVSALPLGNSIWIGCRCGRCRLK